MFRYFKTVVVILKFKSLCCNRNYLKKLNEDINNFIMMLRKGLYPYDYMDDWERSNELLFS